jgi:hypothetical protein
MKVEGTFMRFREFFPSSRQRQSRAASVCESVNTARVALLFSAKMTERFEQWYCLRFCQKLGDSHVETIRKVYWVFGDDAMVITQIMELYDRYKDGRTSVESDARSSRPSTKPK